MFEEDWLLSLAHPTFVPPVFALIVVHIRTKYSQSTSITSKVSESLSNLSSDLFIATEGS